MDAWAWLIPAGRLDHRVSCRTALATVQLPTWQTIVCERRHQEGYRGTMNRLLAFVHIEKAAGTTLLYLLRRNWLGRYLDVRPMAAHGEPNLLTADDLRTLRRVNPALRVIGGHAVVPHSNLAEAAPGIRYITLLREPHARYVSQFRYWNRAMGKDWSFERFLDHEKAFDFQTRKLCGAGDVDRAYHALETQFIAVGLVEHFERFLVELTAALKPERFDPRYRERNVGRSDSDEFKKLMDRFGDEIRERNSLDAALYRRVSEELLPSRAERYEGDLAADVAAFQLAQEARPGARLDVPMLLDAALRKGWYEPVTGFIRRRRGLPAQGSY
jgi:hypothetical protein